MVKYKKHWDAFNHDTTGHQQTISRSMSTNGWRIFHHFFRSLPVLLPNTPAIDWPRFFLMVQLWAPQKVSGSRLRSFYSRCRRNVWGDRFRGWLWLIKICFPKWMGTYYKSRLYVCPIFWIHTRVIVWTCWSEHFCLGRLSQLAKIVLQ